MTNELLPTTSISGGALTVQEMKGQIELIQLHMRENMRKDEHYGVIPGCGDKPSLLKSGAEKLAFIFKLSPSFGITEKTLERGHREYQVLCTLTHYPSGTVIAQGVGACSTMESKFRYRSENTHKPVPKEYWDNRDIELLGGSSYSARKVDKNWFIFHRVEHDNPADYYNTVLKMAKKRAQVDATLSGTAASDIFTQDVEDMEANGVVGSKPDIITTAKPATTSAPVSEAAQSKPASSGDYIYKYKPPYAQKDEAKSYGCKWCPETKTWDHTEYIEEFAEYLSNPKPKSLEEQLEQNHQDQQMMDLVEPNYKQGVVQEDDIPF